MYVSSKNAQTLIFLQNFHIHIKEIYIRHHTLYILLRNKKTCFYSNCNSLFSDSFDQWYKIICLQQRFSSRKRDSTIVFVKDFIFHNLIIYFIAGILFSINSLYAVFIILFRISIKILRIRTPGTPNGTSFQKNRGSYSRSIVK